MREKKTEMKILKAAEDEFLLKGYAGARTVSIAEHAGVTHAMLHYYYKTKEQLFESIFQNKINELHEMLLNVIDDSDIDIVDRIKLVVDRHFEYMKQNPNLPRFIINEISINPTKFTNLAAGTKKRLSDNTNLFQEQLDIAASKLEICKVNAVDLFYDLVSLNISAFMFLPLFVNIVGTDFDEQKFLDARRQEIIELICKRLIP